MSTNRKFLALAIFASQIGLIAGVPPASAQDWYPLFEGAAWHYRSDGYQVTVSVQAPEERLGLTVWPVLYEVVPVAGTPFESVYYTYIDGSGDVVRIGGSFHPDSGFWEFLPSWLFLKLPPSVGTSWDMGYDDQVWHPAGDKTAQSWLVEEDIVTPAGSFHVYSCGYASVAEGVGVVRQRLASVMSPEMVELVSYNLPVRNDTGSWGGIKALFLR